MFLGNAEYVAAERQKDALRRAEQMRLVQSLAAQPTNHLTHRVVRAGANWLGSQLVKWGLRLQGKNSPLSPPAMVTGASNNC